MNNPKQVVRGAILLVVAPFIHAAAADAQFSLVEPGSQVRIIRFSDSAPSLDPEVVRGIVLVADSQSLIVSVEGEDGVVEVFAADGLDVRVLRPTRHLAYRTSQLGSVVGTLVGVLAGFFLSGEECLGSAPACHLLGIGVGAATGAFGGLAVGFSLGSLLHQDEWRILPGGVAPPVQPDVTAGLQVTF